jgi:hypothetical protein
MAVTAAQIQAEFPEFADTDSALIAAKIADAADELDELAWGPLYDQAVKYRACDLLALNPRGEQARLSLGVKGLRGESDALTLYAARFRELLRSRSAPMVI